MQLVAMRLDAAGHAAEAELGWQRAHEAGNPYAVQILAKNLKRERAIG
jgi:hypothetical protein